VFVDAHANILRPATVSRAIAAISVAHRDRNMADPTKARVVRVAMKRLWRVRGRRRRFRAGSGGLPVGDARQRAPVPWQELIELVGRVPG